MISIINTSKNNIICENCLMADTFFKRFKGLMLKDKLPQNHGLYIKKCNSIHMFFMRFSLDVLFVSKDKEIIHLIENIKPWQISRIIKNSVDVIELPAGTVKQKNIEINDIIFIIAEDVK